MTPRTALIVGAGISGLAAAVALRRDGWRVRVFGRAAEHREPGFALHLPPNALDALRELGLADEAIAGGSIVGEIEVRRAEGRVLKRIRIPVRPNASMTVVILRPVLYRILLSATGRDSVAPNSEAIAFDTTDDAVALILKGDRRETGDIVVGADGLNSVIRRRLRPDEPPPPRARYWGIRGVAHGVAHHLGGLSAVAYLSRGVEAAAVRAGGGAVYWYMSLLASDRGAPAPNPFGLARKWAARLDETCRAVIDATRTDDIRLDELWDRDPLSEWGLGRVTLLGDAAHPMLPHTGQGVAQALEDAVALRLALRSGGDVVDCLRKYEHVRARRTRAIIYRARQLARFTTTDNPVVGGVRAAMILAAPVRLMTAAFLLTRRSDPHRALRVPA